MKFGVYVPNFGPYGDAAAMAELAATAEGAGWDGFFVWDHIVVADEMAVGDPWVILSAVAVATERVAIGPMVTPLPRRRPWVVARQAVTLDRLCGGRLILGVGLGFPPHEEFATFGEPTDAAVRAALLDEGLDVIVGMWSGVPFSYSGRHFSVAETTFRPAPLQEPRIPIWVAGTWPNPGPFRRAARYEGVFPLAAEGGSPGLISPDGVAAARTAVAAHRGGMEGYEISVPVKTTGDPEADRAALDAYAAAGVTWAQIGPAGEKQSIDDAAGRIAAGPPRL